MKGAWGDVSKPFGSLLGSGLSFLILLFSSLNVVVVASMVSENADTSSIVFASNNDASVAITTATQTRWFNDNGWRPYGPLYYRFAYSLVQMVPYFKAPNLTPSEANQVRHHYSLMMVSLVSLFLTCFLISGLFNFGWVERIGVASLFLSLFLLNRSFSRYLLVAHPDHLLALFTALLFFVSYRYLMNPTRPGLIFVGVAFGLMLSTKITAILFLPGIFWVLFRQDSWRASLWNGGTFALSSVVAYFLVGFPQNFKIRETLEFLNYYSQFSSPANGASVMEWLGLFFHQFWKPLVLALALCPLAVREHSSVRPEDQRSRRLTLMKLFLLGFIPPLVLMSRKLSTPHDYYTIPFGILCLMGIVVLVRDGVVPVNFPKFVISRKVLLLVLVPFLAARSNTYFASVVKEETINRNSYREIQAWIGQKAREGHTVLLTSYVPMPEDSTGIIVDSDYSFEKLKGINYSAMALNKSMYSRFLVGERPSDYVMVDFQKRDWRPVREFFKYFNDGADVKTPDGREWHMVGDQCDIQLWQVKSK